MVGIHQMVQENYMVLFNWKKVFFEYVFVFLLGDLMYLHVTTCEEKSFHITACTKGFYVNQ